MMTFA